MTRQHFAAIAVVLAAEFPVSNMPDGTPRTYAERDEWHRGAYDLWNTVVLNMAAECARWNPQFNRSKFLDACNSTK